MSSRAKKKGAQFGKLLCYFVIFGTTLGLFDAENG